MTIKEDVEKAEAYMKAIEAELPEGRTLHHTLLTLALLATGCRQWPSEEDK